MFYNSHKNKEKKAIPSSYMHGINDSVNVENWNCSKEIMTTEIEFLY